MLFSSTLAFLAAWTSLAQTEPVPAPARDDTVIALRENSYGLYEVDVSLGRQLLFSGNPNSDPLPFIIDTGANTTAIPRIIAQQLLTEDELNRERVGHGMTGQFETDLFFTDQLNFGLGDRPVDIAVIYDTYGSILSAAGLLGLNALGPDPVQIHFPEQTLQQAQGDIRADLAIDPATGLIKGWARMRGREEPIAILLDTGASVTLVNTALASQSTRRDLNPNAETTQVQGVNSVLQQAQSRRIFPGLNVGNLCFPMFTVSVSDVYAFGFHGWLDTPAVILGMDVLQHAQIAIDHDSGHVSLDGYGEFECP